MKKKRALPKAPNARALTKSKCIEKQNSAEKASIGCTAEEPSKVLNHKMSVVGAEVLNHKVSVEKSSPTTKHRRLSRAVKKLVGNKDGSIEQTSVNDIEPPDCAAPDPSLEEGWCSTQDPSLEEGWGSTPSLGRGWGVTQDLSDDMSAVFLPESPLMSPHHWSDHRSASDEIVEILQSHVTEEDDEVRGFLVSEEKSRTKPLYLSDINETSLDCDFRHMVEHNTHARQVEKRNSVALLVDIFEKQKKEQLPANKTKLHRLSHVPDTSPLASSSLPPSLYCLLTHNSDDDEVAGYMKASSTSNLQQVSSEEEYFVPSGFSTKNSLTILNNQITRRKEGQLEGYEVTLSDCGLPHKNKRKKRSIYQDKSNSLSTATVRRYSLGRAMSLDPCRTRTKTLNSETEHSGQSSLFGPKLKAGALASLLKNKKAEDQFKSVSTECLATVPVIERAGAEKGIGERQRSQSAEHSHRFICCSKSAPTENANCNHSPATAASNHSPATISSNYSTAVASSNHSTAVASSNHSPAVASSNHSPTVASSNHSPAVASSNHSPAVASRTPRAVLRSCPEQSPTIRFSTAERSPILLSSPLCESPALELRAFQRRPAFSTSKSLSVSPHYQGFRSITPASCTSVVKPILTPVPRTPIPFQLDQRFQELESMVEQIVSKMGCLTTRPSPSYRVNTMRRYSRPNYNKRLRTRLRTVESLVQRINTQIKWYRASTEGTLDDVLNKLDLMHIKSKLVSEDISIAEFYLLTKRDMRELGLSVGVRRRILCYINGS